jgi:hypothetical protein
MRNSSTSAASMRPPRAKPSPPTGQVLIAALLEWLESAPENIVADMRRLHDEREAAAELLASADKVRADLNAQIAKLNSREALVAGRESALQRREASVAEREAALAKLRAELTSL